LNEIKDICILGHFINDIDLLYFEHVIKIVGNNIKWTINYHNDDERDVMRKNMRSIGATGEMIFIKMNNLK